VQTVFISQVVCIGLPAGLMTLLFTRKPMKTLMLDKRPRMSHLLAAGLLAVFLYPWGQKFTQLVQQLYPYSPEVAEQVTQFSKVMIAAPNWWLPLLLIGLLPAVCEEIAFRGFVLSGLRHLGHKWWAIGLSAIAFGMAHFFLQQKISATAVGVVIGFMAVQTGSLIPCMVFHALYNSLTLLTAQLAESLDTGGLQESYFRFVFQAEGESLFHPWVMALSLVGSLGLLWWFQRMPYLRTDEEQLQETRDKQLLHV